MKDVHESLPVAGGTNGRAKVITITKKTFFTSTNSESFKWLSRKTIHNRPGDVPFGEPCLQMIHNSHFHDIF